MSRTKGTGTIYKRERNGKIIWEGRVAVGYDPQTGKRLIRFVYGKTQRETQRKINDIIHQLDHGEYIDPDRLSVEDWMKRFIEVYCRDQLKPYTVTKYESIMRNHIIPNLGRLQLQKVTGTDVQMMVKKMTAAGLSVKSVRDVIGLCHHAFEVAVTDGIIQSNPADRVKAPKTVRKEIHPLEDREVPLFLEAIEGSRFRNAFALSLFAGLREGECLGLSWRQVDLKAGTLLIDQQMQRINGERVIVPFTKSNKPRRITLPRIAVDYLRDEQLNQMKNKLAHAMFWTDSDLVFTNEAGEMIPVASYYKEFKRIAAQIGRPDLRPHDLRHTAATIAIASGADIKSVQDLLGHATASFTLNVYAHTSEKMARDTADRMQDYFSSIKK